MAEHNPLNIFRGEDSIRKFYNPDCAPPVPLVELPHELNPFYSDNVRIYAKLLTALPAQNVKSLPALNMLENEPACAKKTIVESSSGSTATSLGLGSRVLYGNKDVQVYITNKCEMNRLNQLLFWGLRVHLYGGPAQPEIQDERGIVARLERMAKESPETVYNPNQYTNDNNWRSHIRWTGPQLWKQLPEINVFAMGMGSAGCVSGTGLYLKKQKASVKVLGVCNAINDPVPGPRPEPLMHCSQFPWRDAVDQVLSVSSKSSFAQSLELSRQGIAAGPSSGMALQGLLDWLQAEKSAGRLSQHADAATGEVHCVFVCCDLPHMHLDQYFAKLDDTSFHPIVDKELLFFDQDKYDLTWELSPEDAIFRIFGSPEHHLQNGLMRNKSTCASKTLLDSVNDFGAVLLDLRHSRDYDTEHIEGSLSSPLWGLDGPPKDLFWDVKLLHKHWKSMKTKFEEDTGLLRLLSGCAGPVYVVCYDGEIARLATAVIRAQKYEAFSIKGGIEAIRQLRR
ncbi:hypothetical protein QQS21_007346 [Conoideocrella luteorostrata]|uniref:Rhodanese domain-containing protein n=1 Tax=Conoideocrella luteorostrata TaxID=1105319 RepID=A0AAJ0FXG5_9HYPO|nr:hypothetical protein QQS21_007346 [Conoideocrella luteorostrata]